MPRFNRILFPFDLSKNSLSALDLATQLAKQSKARLCFVYVLQPLLPTDAIYAEPDDEPKALEEAKAKLEKVRPTDPSVEFEHQVLRGNAATELVRATKSADICVMSTHGRTGLMRVLMGSVAQYVFRYAKCPVVLAKGFEAIEASDEDSFESKHFVSEFMHVVAPVRKTDKMKDVLDQLQQANETGAPVTDELDRCIGILTTTDIENYHSLKRRFEDQDETVIEEMFETDKYGHVRCDNHDFDEVQRHMTSEVIAVRDDDSMQVAINTFEAHPELHHLVVLDEDDEPVGILDSTNLFPGIEFLDDSTPQANSASKTKAR